MPSPSQVRITKYAKLVEQFRRQIESGQLRPGDRLPPAAQIRAQHGVSLCTAEKAFAELEKEGLIVRQQGSGTFVATRRKATGLIGFLGTTFALRHTTLPEAYMAAGIEQAAAQAGKSVVLLSGLSPAGWDQVEGVLILDCQDQGAWLRSEHPQLPAVHLLVGSKTIASVSADEAGGASAAVEHLLRLGHTRIGCLFNGLDVQRPSQTTARFAGYLAGLHAAGIQPAPGWIYDPGTSENPDAGYRHWGYNSMRRWLKAGWRRAQCTALLAQNDLAAIGAMEALLENGIKVPRDVSVIGFDSTEICECVSPGLSAVKLPLYDMGCRAVELLLKEIALHPELARARDPEQVILPTSIEQRESTAPCASRPLMRRGGNRALENVWGPTGHSRMLNLLEGVSTA